MVEMYTVRTIGEGFIALMPKPDAGKRLENEFIELKEKGVKVLVSLLEQCETETLALQNEPTMASKYGIRFISHPIPDRGIPGHSDSFLTLVLELRDNLMEGMGVAVHCWGGIGRSGLLVAAVLTTFGFTPAKAFQEVSKARHAIVPEVRSQGMWLKQHHLNRQNKK